jgi:S1-C subfamily serine protease
VIDWIRVKQPVREDDTALWLEHPDGRAVDVAALELDLSDSRISTSPVALTLADADIFVGVGMAVSVVGYPFGRTRGAEFPIWKTGHVASEPDVNFQDRPVFLIDATTRRGMSGSPVYFQLGDPGYLTRNRTALVGHGFVSPVPEDRTRLLGVYSGRIQGLVGDGEPLSAEIGRVWKPHVIAEVLDHGSARPTGE